MNIVLKKTRPVEYYVACVKKNGAYVVYGKYVTKDGELREHSKSEPFRTESEAVVRCRNLAKMKVRKKGFKELPLDEIPEKVAKHMEVPPNMQVTAEEMLQHIKQARSERYVVFSDVGGMEEYFDVDVEYVAHTTDEEGVLTVYDRFGDSRQCFAERMKSIVATEDAKQAQGIRKL